MYPLFVPLIGREDDVDVFPPSFINTVKYIKMACSSNFGNVFSVLGQFY
jgi:hypothetical protein